MTIVKRTIERKQTDHSGTEPDINPRKEKKQRKEVDAGNQFLPIETYNYPNSIILTKIRFLVVNKTQNNYIYNNFTFFFFQLLNVGLG
jgi:hypothetical protein